MLENIAVAITSKLANNPKQQTYANNIFAACTIDADHNLIYKGEKVGWIKPWGIGWMDPKAYKQICEDIKNGPILPISASDYDEAYDEDYYDNMEDNE